MFVQDVSEKKPKLQNKNKSHLTTIFNIFFGMYIVLIKVFCF